MAATDVLSVNKTKYDAGGSGDNYLDSGEMGDAKIYTDSYVSAAIEAESTVTFGPVPSGRIASIRLVFEAMGTSVTCTLGDSTDADRYYATGTDIAAIGQLDSILIGGVGYVIGTNDDDGLIVLTTEAATMTASKTIKMIVTYV